MPRPEPVWMPCKGDAHKDFHIDHCWDCAPYWGWYPVCSTCGLKLKDTTPKDATTAQGRRLWCPKCRKHYAFTKPPAGAGSQKPPTPTPALPDSLVRAGRRRLAELNDDITRAKMQQRADPEWKDGLGTPIAKVIADYEKEVDLLHAAIGYAT